jgi:hypothetical protein
VLVGLGHSVSTTTLNTYAHAVRVSKDNTASLWDDLMGRSSGHAATDSGDAPPENG